MGERRFRVSWDSWLDREWSSRVLADDQIGWDWLALQLHDGGDLMFYHLRGNDGEPQVLCKGVLVDADGDGSASGNRRRDPHPNRNMNQR